jgi:TldD protein
VRVLPLSTVEALLSIAMSKGGDFAEVYVERTVVTSLSLDDGRIRSGNSAETTGVGVRVIKGAQVGYAYSDDLDDAALRRVAETAAQVAQGHGEPPPVKVTRRHAPEHYRIAVGPGDVPLSEKAALLMRADAAARAHDPRVKQVMGSWADSVKSVLVANTLGHFAEDLQDMARMHVSVVAIDKSGERRTGSYGGGGRVPFSHFETFSPEAIARESARQAVAMFGAVDAPAGPQSVVLAPGWSGILLHEAVGHGLEADFIRKKTSLFAGKVGERVASELVTVIDDGTVAGGRGSLNVDDEGNPAQRKVLIENGILKGYLYDALNAQLMGKESTGSGRRESFQHAPLPRMTNTFLAPGESDPEEIVRSVKKGLYAAHFGGGQVDITNGNFVFEVGEAYLIEDGRLTRPVKGATLIGVGPVALQNVSMVGNDPAHDPGMGTCGKSGQGVPVGVGLPTLRIDNLTVGGTRVG